MVLMAEDEDFCNISGSLKSAWVNNDGYQRSRIRSDPGLPPQ
jgi:hypothetical protein